MVHYHANTVALGWFVLSWEYWDQCGGLSGHIICVAIVVVCLFIKRVWPLRCGGLLRAVYWKVFMFDITKGFIHFKNN